MSAWTILLYMLAGIGSLCVLVLIFGVLIALLYKDNPSDAYSEQ